MSGSIACSIHNLRKGARYLLCQTAGSAILEFAIALPLLVVFVVGIYDFSGAFNQKQKIEQAAQEGAIIAGAQPTSDLNGNSNPPSLQPVVAAVFNSLAGSGVLAQANQTPCSLNPQPTPSQLPFPGVVVGPFTWIYTIPGCSGYTDTNRGCMSDPNNNLWIVINRAWVPAVAPGSTAAVPVGTSVMVSYDYHWRFNSAIQLLIPGAGYSAKSCISETSTVLNQS
ncbi:MAG: TadE family protein [Terriglobales bacterium]